MGSLSVPVVSPFPDSITTLGDQRILLRSQGVEGCWHAASWAAQPVVLHGGVLGVGGESIRQHVPVSLG